MRFFNFLLTEEDKQEYIEERNKLFAAVADQQRGIPERLMLKIQHHFGGGPLNVVVEHGGDIIHRMTEAAKYDSWGADTVHEKTKRCLHYLEHSYGFERELYQNIETNSKYRDMTPAEFKDKLFMLLKQYGDEHAKLPVYNKQQWLARKATIALGKRDWKTAIFCYKKLYNNVKSGNWKALASEFTVKNGKIVEFKL